MRESDLRRTVNLFYGGRERLNFTEKLDLDSALIALGMGKFCGKIERLAGEGDRVQGHDSTETKPKKKRGRPRTKEPVVGPKRPRGRPRLPENELQRRRGK